MSLHDKAEFKLNWSTTKLVLPDPSHKAIQEYYEQRYGVALTKAIKIARKNICRKNAGK